MNQYSAFVLVFCFMFFHVKAQPPLEQGNGTSRDFVTSFRPSLALVMGVLSIMFSLTFILIVYAKFCRRETAFSAHADRLLLQRSRSRFSGIDKTVIESLPFFRFSSLRGSKDGLECAVCLSKFEDVEILRLLPKCKHAFHIGCVDQWLESHSSCPLCRRMVTAEDVAVFSHSSSLRWLWNPSERKEDPVNLELFVEREEDHRYGSSRFSIGSSFRKSEKAKKEEELPIQGEGDEERNPFHKLNHKIVVSDVVYKHRWSNVSSSDIMFLNSEMIRDVSSNRFSSLDTRIGIDDDQVMKIKEEMEKKRSFKNKMADINTGDSPSVSGIPSTSGSGANSSVSAGKRSKSEIAGISRFGERNRVGQSSLMENNIREERMRRLWVPIARRTVQWFASRERWSQRYHRGTRQQSLNG